MPMKSMPAQIPAPGSADKLMDKWIDRNVNRWI